MCPSMNLLMQLLGSARKTTPIFEVRGRGWRQLVARARSHPDRRRGPLSGVDLPPERWPQSAARDPEPPFAQALSCKYYGRNLLAFTSPFLLTPR
jgi:hypothetical protein